jgi:molecular chaperone GrpE
MAKDKKDEQEMQATTADGDQSGAAVEKDAELLKQLEGLQSELEEAQAQATENLDGWQRAQAEFANYKKRIARDQEQLYLDAGARIIKRYLEIVDDLERALENRPANGEGAEWASGIELIYRKFQAFLEGEGVTKMQALGEAFDPNLHEAIAKEENMDYASGAVSEVVQPGYMIGDRVLRPAIVKVAE